MERSDPLIGRRLSHYLVAAPLGRGGMGAVYLATDSRLGRSVALKVLPPEAGQAKRRERFLREAQAASALNHPGIVTIHDVGHDAGVDFIVMERVSGRTLLEVAQKGPVPPEEALGYVRQAAAALAVAHAAGIVHRDIKPQNLMITDAGQLKVLDFGLAFVDPGDEAGSQDETRDRLTAIGALVGTPGYMSPEQAEGLPVDASTDVFSLGVVFYQLLTGTMPFQGTSVAGVLYQIVHRAPEPVEKLRPGLDRAIVDLLDAMLCKERRQRIANGADLLRALSGAEAAAAAARRARERPAGKRRRPWIAAAAIALAALAAGGALLWKSRTPPSTRTGSAPAAPAGGDGSSSAYDRYLEGVELLKRWDKGDNLDEAVRLFGDATAQDPTFALAFARLADAQRIRYALSHDKAVLEAAAKSAEQAERLNPKLAPVQTALGRVLSMRGNNDLAYAAFERALALDPNDADAHQAMARQYERLGRPKDAEAAFQQAVTLDPENLSVLDGYGNFLYRQGRFEDAARQWQALIRLAPDHAGALVNLGSALSDSGRFAEAVTMYERAVALKPTYMAYSNLGTAYSRSKRYHEAVEAYRKALQIDDKDWLAWGNLGYVLSWSGDDAAAAEPFARAIALAEAARKENPRDAAAHSDLALYYAKAGKAPLARARAKTALALSPESAEVLSAAAEVHERLGERDEALALAKKALAAGLPRQTLLRNPELTRLLADPRMR